LCQFALKSIPSFSKYSVTSCEQTDDEWTGTEHYTYSPPAILDCIAYVCFYDAERVLSPIAKFLFTSLGKGRGGVKWEGVRIGEERREGREDYGRRKMGLHKERSPKCNIFGIRECPLRGTNHTFLKSPFHEQHLPCRYASNLNHLKIIKL